MERTILESYERNGWVFHKKSKKDVVEMDPLLGGGVTGDLVSMYSPRSSSWIFPSEAEAYFGVQTDIFNKLVWINVMKSGVTPFWLVPGYEDNVSS